MNLTDIAIKCKQGDRDAFGSLYEVTLPSMRKVALRYVGDSDTAADIIHDGYIVAMTSIDSLKDPAKVEGWLATIIKNLALQEIRSKTYTTDCDSGEGGRSKNYLLPAKSVQKVGYV